MNSRIGVLRDLTGSAVDFVQPVVSAQPRIVRDGTMNQRAYLSFNGTTERMYSLAKDYWTFMHDGTGMTMYCLVEVASTFDDQIAYIFGNQTGTGSTVGTTLIIDDRNSVPRVNAGLFYVSNSPNVVVGIGASTNTNNFATPGTAQILTASYKFDTPNDKDGVIYKDGVEFASQDSATAPSSAVPVNNTFIGSSPTPNGYFPGKIGAILVYRTEHDSATRTALENNLKAYFGI
jgi:hypothetical protein